MASVTDDNNHLISSCRLTSGEIWVDPVNGHIVGCGDATDTKFTTSLFEITNPAKLAIHDPPYNLVMFKTCDVSEFITWCEQWIENTRKLMVADSSLYIWLGADQNNHFQPLPQFMLMMAGTEFKARSFITMRNQRGYGTQKNWMALRQELLYYTLGSPDFDVLYTDIPKTVRGYYKNVKGSKTENIERSKSKNIRPGNVWVDIQQVFYRLKENVEKCPAQKPLKSIERIIEASSNAGDVVLDFFAHSGTTLLACERLKRRAVTIDIDPIFIEITIRRLEHYRKTGELGWQREDPFGS